jgi:hypothetical protein
MKWQPPPNPSKPETGREPLQRRDAEIAETSAEKGNHKFNTSGAFLSPNVFSALPLRALRLCVELTAPLTTSLESPCPL